MPNDFYNSNEFRAYPFIASAGISDKVVVDAGFIMGENSGFEYGVNAVTMTSINIGATTSVVLSSDAPGLVGVPIIGSTTDSEGYVLIDVVAHDVVDRPDLLSGWIVINRSAPYSGAYAVNGEFEPALIQAIGGTFVTTLSLYNKDRPTEDSVPTTFTPVLVGAVGDIYFEDGYNTTVSVNQSTSLLLISAIPGSGKGYFCDWDFSGLAQTCGNLVASIGGVCANESGVVDFTGDYSVFITPVSDHCLSISLGNTNQICADSSVIA